MEKLAYKYSVVIPHKNCPDLLRRCVESIPLRNDIQIIIVDDCSDADQKPKLQRPGVEIFLMDSECAKGAGRARNEGMKNAKGTWVLFADSDDYFYDGFWSIIDSIVSDGEFDVRYFCVDSVDSDTLQPVERASKRRLNTLVKDYIQGKDGSEDDLRFHYNVPWGKIFRRDFVFENNIRFDETPVANDVMFSTLSGSKAKLIKAYNDVMYVVTVRNGSLVSKIDKNSLRCRFMVCLRHNVYCKTINKTHCTIRVMPFVKSALRRYGPIEFLWYIGKLFKYKQNPFKGTGK